MRRKKRYWKGLWDIKTPKLWSFKYSVKNTIHSFRDSDRDGVPDILDCMPRDPKKHFVPVSFARVFEKIGKRKKALQEFQTKATKRGELSPAQKKAGWREYYGYHTKYPSGKSRIYVDPVYHWKEAERMKRKYPKQMKGIGKERAFRSDFTATLAHEALHHAVGKAKEVKEMERGEGEEKAISGVEYWRAKRRGWK